MSEPKAPTPAARPKKEAPPASATASEAAPTGPQQEAPEVERPPFKELVERPLHRQCFLHILTGFVAGKINPDMNKMANQAARMADVAEAAYLTHLAGEKTKPAA